jgi:hypothetical protein
LSGDSKSTSRPEDLTGAGTPRSGFRGPRYWSGISRVQAMTWTTPRLAWAVLATMMLVAGGWMLYITRGGTFHYDEWNFVVNRRGHSLETFFRPHNEHISAVPVLMFKTLFETVGLTRYWPYQLMPIVLHLVCALLIYVLARRRLGDWWALIPTGLVVFFGAAWQDILWPFQIGYLIPVAAFLGAILLLARGDIAGDVAATILVGAGIASSGFGVPLTVGVATYLALDRNRVVRLAGVVGIPLAFYLVWNSHYGVVRGVPWNEVPEVPRRVIDMVGATLAAVLGLTPQFGPVLAALFAVAVGLYLVKNRPLTPTLAAASVGALASFAVLALFRAGQFGGRYYYPVGVLLILTLVELAPTNLPRRITARGFGVIAVVSAIFLVGQVGSFRYGGNFFRDWARFVPTSLGALELARDHVDPAFRPDPVRAPDIEAAKYFDTTKDFGSPADSPTEILRRPEDARENADSVLSAALRIGVQQAPRPNEPGPIPRTAALFGGIAQIRAGCLLLDPETPRSSAEVRLPAAGVWLRPEQGANAEVRLRRFGATYPVGDEPPAKALFGGYVVPAWGRDFIRPTVLRPQEGTGGSIVIPADRAPNIPWYAQITADRPTEICALGV